MMGKAQGLLARSVTRVLPRFLRRSSGKSLASFVCLSFVVASVGLLPACGTGKPSAPPIFHFVILFGGLSESFRQSFLF